MASLDKNITYNMYKRYTDDFALVYWLRREIPSIRRGLNAKGVRNAHIKPSSPIECFETLKDIYVEVRSDSLRESSLEFYELRSERLAKLNPRVFEIFDYESIPDSRDVLLMSRHAMKEYFEHAVNTMRATLSAHSVSSAHLVEEAMTPAELLVNLRMVSCEASGKLFQRTGEFLANTYAIERMWGKGKLRLPGFGVK